MEFERVVIEPPGASLVGDDREVSGILPDELPQQSEIDDVIAAFGDEEQEEAEPDYSAVPHEANLAEFMSEEELQRIANDLAQKFRADQESRSEWEKTGKDGLELLGLEIKPPRDEVFKGATAVVDPVITEAIVRFQSNAIQEIFPAEGPVDVKIRGKVTDQKREAAQRKKDFMNHTLVTVMDDYREETEKLLWDLGYCGAAFRKIYNDPETLEAVGKYLPAEKVIIPYGYGNLWKAPRYSCIIDLDPNELKRLQISGFYRDINLGPAKRIERGVFEEAKDQITKEFPSDQSSDGYQLVEMYCQLRLHKFEPRVPDDAGNMVEAPEDGIASPYIVTFDKDTNKVLSIYRNWAEGDERRKPTHWIVQYSYITGPGSYGFGIIHLIGNLAKGATGILRNLIDSGVLSTLASWFSTGVRQKDGTISVRPGSVVNLDVAATGKLSEALMRIEFPQPSQVLAGVRQEMKQDARQLASITDTEIGSAQGGEIPVGTMLAMLERSLKVMSAVQARLHRSLRKEFLLLDRVIKRQLHELVEKKREEDSLKSLQENGMMPPEQDIEELEYPYDVVGGERTIKLADFMDTLASEPVSDPTMATFAQRVIQYQAVLNLSQQAPQVYDLPKLHREFVRFIGVKEADDIVPDKKYIPHMDASSENSMLIMGSPVKAYPWQDHASHIATHIAFVQDPKRKADVGQMPQGQQIMAAATAHIAEHIAYESRREVERELGFPLPPLGDPLSPEIEIRLSAAIAEAYKRVFELHKREAELQQREEQAKDPVYQATLRDLEIKEFKAKQDAEIGKAKVQADATAKAEREETERMRIEAQMLNNEKKLENETEWVDLEAEKFDRDQPKVNAEIMLLKAQIAKLMADVAQMQQPKQESSDGRD